jgi:hypothetical protein
MRPIFLALSLLAATVSGGHAALNVSDHRDGMGEARVGAGQTFMFVVARFRRL